MMCKTNEGRRKVRREGEDKSQPHGGKGNLEYPNAQEQPKTPKVFGATTMCCPNHNLPALVPVASHPRVGDANQAIDKVQEGCHKGTHQPQLFLTPPFTFLWATSREETLSVSRDIVCFSPCIHELTLVTLICQLPKMRKR